MEDEMLLKQPTDRRLGDNSTLPPGPPGAEFDTPVFESKNAPPKMPALEKENSSAERGERSERSSRRRSPSGSPPPRKRRSTSRGRRSPSSPPSRRGRRSPSPRRNRFRDYSPDRRRYGRRSPDRRSRYNRGGKGRDRYRGGRGRSSSRSLSRSPTPPSRRGGGSRWSPKKKPSSPAHPPPITASAPPPPYGVMPPQMYGDAYGAPGYNQYGVPPPQAGFPADAYSGMPAQSAGFNAAYPPPGSWGVDAYGQQQWMAPPPAQIRQMPPPQQPPPQQPPPTVQQPPPQQPQASAPSPAVAAPQTAATANSPVVTNTNVPPPPTLTNPLHVLSDAAPGTVEPNPQHDAVAQEAENQRDELKKQRTSYLKKTAILKKELKMLKEQRKELHSGKAPASPTTKGFIDENEKLQSQIQKKLSTIENVIDMLTGIIGDDNIDKDDDVGEADADQLLKDAAASAKSSAMLGGSSTTSKYAAEKERVAAEKPKKQSSSSSSDDSTSDSSSSSSDSSSSSENEEPNKADDDDDSSPERLKKKVIESMKNKDKDLVRKVETKVPTKKERFNYVFYDPEMHWCQTCNIFPKTAKDYLNHLHSKEHMDRESIETPWHTDMVTDQFPTYDNVPTKRTPIRGLTFFVPATAWFCKLCSIWMGDLHCASTHLKSQLHASKYNSFLEENPHYEVNWLADRQKVLNDQKVNPLPQQITSVSTTAAERKKSKKDDDKSSSKKRKKKSDKKQKKKKKKSTKKRKKNDSDSSDSSSSDSSSSTESDEPKKKKLPPTVEIKDLNNPNPAGVSIRLSMRKQETAKHDEGEVLQAPPPPQLKGSKDAAGSAAYVGGKWTVVQEGVKTNRTDDQEDDGIIQEWNTVQPVISESEKKLLEQLKGKLKNKTNSEQQQSSKASNASNNNNINTDNNTGRSEVEKENRRERRSSKDRRDSRDRYDKRDRNSRDNRDNRDRRTARRSISRSPTRSRSRGRDYRRHMRRSRSASRGRGGGWRGRRRNDRSRSRSIRRRSRSYDRRGGRRNSRSRTRSPSRSRVEKPIVRQPEFRPRVPEKDKEKEKKAAEKKEKKETQKPKPAATSTAANSKTKLPFIGKMPVFKKQATGQQGDGEKRPDDAQTVAAGGYMYPMDASAYGTMTRPPAPTAAQIQMAMMEDAYGNAPPFHPDAGMMVDYDDLMPDPVQFVNIMGQAPPPPPPQQASDDKDMLPPGIDEEESEEFLTKTTVDGPPPISPGKGDLPQDLEDALNIIFPGEKKLKDEDDEKAAISKGETQIINDEPKFQPEELAKDGIHLVTIEETSQLGLDEASQMSMNEPLVFNRPSATNPSTAFVADMDIEDSNSHSTTGRNNDDVPPKPSVREIAAKQEPLVEETATLNNDDNSLSVKEEKEAIDQKEKSDNLTENDIPMPENVVKISSDTSEQSKIVATSASEQKQEDIIHHEIDLADIPQPPPSPTESEKNRRQEELDDLAMLGIDADDMAAQCM
ncbi:zinc finger matrin-type protein CG9776 [Musca domestica]|uniref:Zinc finger matrin-type protein CG9776 n=1 Tax=Musca domestica TaxID=7370 RepID=A0A9J7CV73_MUSDO|nr:zinc finger matrin-type protein CG9776 [Musca domestica]